MRTTLLAAFICICAIQATASDSGIDQHGGGRNVEQKKTEILQHIQERITNSQAEMACVNAAASHEEFKACHDKYRPAPPKQDKRSRAPQE